MSPQIRIGYERIKDHPNALKRRLPNRVSRATCKTSTQGWTKEIPHSVHTVARPATKKGGP